MLGTDFPYRQFYPEGKSARVVQIDIRPEQLGRPTGIDLGLVGDVKATLKALLPLIEPNGDSTRATALCQGTLSHLAGRIILALMALLSPVQEDDLWRVRMVWPNGTVQNLSHI